MKFSTLGVVSAASLHRKTLLLERRGREVGRLRGASLFPFFDSEGTIRSIMLVWPGSSWIVALSPGQVRLPRWSSIRIEADLGELRDLDAEQTRELASLWHVDPWWVLKEPRFFGHRSVPALRATNTVAKAEAWSSTVSFYRDLSRIVGPVPGDLEGDPGDETANEKVPPSEGRDGDLASGDGRFDREKPFDGSRLPERVAPRHGLSSRWPRGPARASWRLRGGWPARRDAWRLRMPEPTVTSAASSAATTIASPDPSSTPDPSSSDAYSGSEGAWEIVS